MKKEKFFIYNCILLFSLVLLYKISKYILRLNGIGFLNVVKFIFATIFTILLFSILIQVIVLMYYYTNRNITATVLISFIIGGSMVLYLFGCIISYAFTDVEHIIEKDGKKMIAYVDSFLQVEVKYYDYINSFIRGNKIRIYEDYGSGGFDPFEKDEILIPIHSTYYDDNGNLIKSN